MVGPRNSWLVHWLTTPTLSTIVFDYVVAWGFYAAGALHVMVVAQHVVIMLFVVVAVQD